MEEIPCLRRNQFVKLVLLNQSEPQEEEFVVVPSEEAANIPEETSDLRMPSDEVPVELRIHAHLKKL